MNLHKSADKSIIITHQYLFCGAHVVVGQPLKYFPIAALHEIDRTQQLFQH
jgi:hypothetical protein